MGIWILNGIRGFWLEQQLSVGAARTAALWESQVCRELRSALPPDDLGAPLAGANGSVNLLEALPAQRFSEAAKTELAGRRLDDDTIRFATSQVRDTLGRIRPGIVEYKVQRNRPDGVNGIYRKSAADLAGLESATEVLAARSVVSLNVQYQKKNGEWLDEWTSAEVLPRAVRMTVGTMPDKPGMSSEVLFFTTEVFLPVGERIEQ